MTELALMDIRMPGFKGHEIARRMRAVDALQDITIILMTAFSLTEDERDSMLAEYGVDRIIHKPLPEFDSLKALLDEALNSADT
jgi:CheY-like chemotaxis protein